MGLATGGQPYQATGVSNMPVERPTLASQGIDKNLAKQARAFGELGHSNAETLSVMQKISIEPILLGNSTILKPFGK